MSAGDWSLETWSTRGDIDPRRPPKCRCGAKAIYGRPPEQCGDCFRAARRAETERAAAFVHPSIVPPSTNTAAPPAVTTPVPPASPADVEIPMLAASAPAETMPAAAPPPAANPFACRFPYCTETKDSKRVRGLHKTCYTKAGYRGILDEVALPARTLPASPPAPALDEALPEAVPAVVVVEPVTQVEEEPATVEVVEGEDAIGLNTAPHRYMQHGRETIDLIRDMLGDEYFMAWCRGSVLKYRCRAGAKGDVLGDAKKADFYELMAFHVAGVGTPDPRSERPNFAPYSREEGLAFEAVLNGLQGENLAKQLNTTLVGHQIDREDIEWVAAQRERARAGQEIGDLKRDLAATREELANTKGELGTARRLLATEISERIDAEGRLAAVSEVLEELGIDPDDKVETEAAALRAWVVYQKQYGPQPVLSTEELLARIDSWNAAQELPTVAQVAALPWPPNVNPAAVSDAIERARGELLKRALAGEVAYG